MVSALRIITALIFIASGFVKAVDVVGFSFKLEEYFSPSVFNIPFLEQLSLPIAIIVVALELVLGFMLLIKIRLKFTLASLIALCVFFAFLTFYSAYYNKVTDCGCFGDAIKFTPWQSFIKDVILLLALLVLWVINKRNPRLEVQKKWKYTTLAIFVALMSFVTLHGITHEPLIDFRDYKIGTDLKYELAKSGENPAVFKTFYSLKNAKTNEVIEIDQDHYVNNKIYWEQGSPWKIEKGKTTSKMISEGYATEVLKFKPEASNGEYLTDKILNAPEAILVFSYAPSKADATLLLETEKVISKNKKALVLGVSTDRNTFKLIPNTLMDGTAIKTIARSNPFVLELHNGVIIEKMSAKDYLKKFR